MVSDVDDKHNRKMYLNAESTSEALANGGVEDKRSLLFCSDSDGSRNSRLARIISIIVGLGIIPLTFFASKLYCDLLCYMPYTPSTMISHIQQFLFSLCQNVRIFNSGSL